MKAGTRWIAVWAAILAVLVGVSPASAAKKGTYDPSDVRGMMAYSMKLAKSVNFYTKYDVKKTWKLKAMRFFEADACPSVKDNPAVGCKGKQAMDASGFGRWLIAIAVVWQKPDKSLVAHTYTTQFKNGVYTKSGYRKQQVLEDRVFTLPKHNMTWAFAKERAWQTANPTVVPVDNYPIFGNVRAPLTPDANDPTLWIFTLKNESGADVYVGVDDKTGEVEVLS